jgi:hypothetical protein
MSYHGQEPPSPSGRRNAIRCYLPQNYDPDSIPERWRDYSAWVVGRIYRDCQFRASADGLDSFTPLWSVRLKETLPRKEYCAILKDLIDRGIIEENKSYCAGRGSHRGWSKSYRLSRPLRDAPHQSHWLTHPELVRKLHRQRERDDRKYDGNEVYRHLRANVQCLEVAPGSPTKESFSLNYIADRESYYTVCGQGRVHTPLTNMGRRFRKYLRAGGLPLVQTDIVNSQPLLLGLTLLRSEALLNDPGFREYSAMTREQWQITGTAEQKGETNTNPDVGIYSYTRPSDRNGDIQRYVECCRVGQIYERLQDLTGYTRDRVKSLYMAVIYGHPNDGDTVVGRAVRQLFPGCWNAIVGLKGDNHPALAKLMQTVESYVVIGRVCRRILEEYPTAPLLTLHDSLVTTPEYIGRFECILLEEFKIVFDVEPLTKQKLFLDV